MDGLPQDDTKAMELYRQAAELDYAAAFHNIGCAYQEGRGVEMDEKKAIYYWERAAMGGDTEARYSLGVVEHKAGNMQRALRHYMIALEDGYSDSLKNIQKLYSNGHTTKDEYTQALRAHQKYLQEVKSIQRDQAAAAFEGYKYYE